MNEQMTKALAGKFKTETVELALGVKITLRELKRPERDALEKRLWKFGEDGKIILESRDGKMFKTPVDGAHFNEEWIAACATPLLTVADLLTEDWPESFKEELTDKARKLNGETVQSAAGN